MCYFVIALLGVHDIKNINKRTSNNPTFKKRDGSFVVLPLPKKGTSHFFLRNLLYKVLKHTLLHASL
jgi:hypothetical protein